MAAEQRTSWGIRILRTGDWMYESSEKSDPWTTRDHAEAMREWRSLCLNKRYEVQPYPDGVVPVDDGVTLEEFMR